MTETERKALVERLGQAKNNQLLCIEAISMINRQARAIEQHEAFKREVSDAVVKVLKWGDKAILSEQLSRFIIAKPDPLVEAWDYMVESGRCDSDALRAALAARGLKIVGDKP